MKKQLLLVLALVVSTCAFSQGFDKSKLRAGFGFLYASEISNLGFKIDGAYSFTEEWEGDVTFSHIFKKDYTTYNTLDFDAHYYFAKPNDKISIYGLAGLNFTFVKVKIPETTSTVYGYTITTPAVEVSDSNAGLNLGIGANYALNDKINLLPEIRYTLIDGSYLRIGISAQYSF